MMLIFNKRVLYPLVFISITFGINNQVISSNIIAKASHPRLFITSENIASLRNRAETTHKDTYTVLKNWADTNWNNPSVQQQVLEYYNEAGVLRYAFIYSLGEIPGFDYTQHSINDYGDKTIQIMLDIVNANLGANLSYVAIAYDWVNNRMNLTQKQTIVNWFRSRAGDPPQLGSNTGYRFSSTPSSFYPGLAFYGDGVNDSLAQTYVNFIQIYLDDARAISHESGKDGGHAAGLCYSHGSYGVIPPLNFGQSLYALTTATNLTIDQTFNTYPFMNGFPDWFLYGVQPGGKAPAPYSDYDTVTLTKFED